MANAFDKLDHRNLAELTSESVKTIGCLQKIYAVLEDIIEGKNQSAVEHMGELAPMISEIIEIVEKRLDGMR